MKLKGKISAIALAAVIAVIGASVFSAYAQGGQCAATAATSDEAAPVKHDVNKDGEFSVKDASALQKYIADYDVEVDEAQLDANYDNQVNIKDSTRMQKLLAGLVVEPDPDEIGKESEDIGKWF